MHGFGGMISLYVKGGLDGARRFMERCELFVIAELLGGVESLVNHLVIMTHAFVSPERCAVLGIIDNFVRLSVGVEDLADLRAELERALA